MKLILTFVAILVSAYMSKDKNYLEKIGKNVIVKHYEFIPYDKSLQDQINQKEQELLELRKKQNAYITIYLPKEHDVLNLDPPFVKENTIAEWDTNFINEHGDVRGKRELVYITQIRDCASMTGKYDETLRYISGFSIENYIKLECIHYGNKSILRLAGRDVKDLVDEKNKTA